MTFFEHEAGDIINVHPYNSVQERAPTCVPGVKRFLNNYPFVEMFKSLREYIGVFGRYRNSLSTTRRIVSRVLPKQQCIVVHYTSLIQFRAVLLSRLFLSIIGKHHILKHTSMNRKVGNFLTFLQGRGTDR